MTKYVRYEDNPRPKIDCSGDEPRTQQSAKDECDINILMSRALRGQDISGSIREGGTFGDFTNVPDLATAMNQVVDANARFMSLDAVVRKRFNNDPRELLSFLSDDANRDEAVKLGLLKKADPVKVDESLETLKSIDSSLKATSGAKSKKRSDED